MRNIKHGFLRVQFGVNIFSDKQHRVSACSRLLIMFFFIFISFKGFSKNYYVDPFSQSLNAVGTEESPWTTLDQASIASSQFLPGDTIFFKRDRVYTGKLNILCSGNQSSPIVFTSYGSGQLPEFDNTLTHIIKLSNNQYIVIDGLKIIDRSVHATDHSKLANTTYAIVLENSPNCTIKNCDISLVGIGISISGNSIGSSVHDNRIYNLRMLRNTPGGTDDFGATAIVLASSNISVTNNHFEDCWGTSYDYLYEGGTVELFGDRVSNNLIAYNTAINNNGFVKVGSISNGFSTDNMIAYNQVINCGYLAILQDTGLYRTRIKNIQFYNNNIVETIQQLRKPTAVFWMPGEGVAEMIVAKNNIFWLSSGINVASTKFDKGQMIHTNNIYRLSKGIVGLSLHSTEFYSPLSQLFANITGDPTAWNYKLTRGSAAIDFGTPVGFNHDFDGVGIFDRPDVGVFEYDSPIIMATIQGGKCYGDSAHVIIQAKGGVPPYIGTGNFSVLPGIKNFSVTDTRGKKDSVKIAIEEIPTITVTASVTPVSPVSATSTINATASGGTPPYQYQLDGSAFQPSALFTGIIPGSYALNVKDVNGCLASRSVEILPYEKLNFSPEDGSKFKVFPNPSNYYFTLNNLVYNSNSSIQLEVYNMKGVLVYSTSARFSDLITFGHHLPQGTYTIRVQIDSFVQSLSVVKL
jgi:hypothetical protein